MDKYLIEYLDAIWLRAGWFDTPVEAWDFIRKDSETNSYPLSYYAVIPVAQGDPDGTLPDLPKGGVRMYRSPTGRSKGQAPQPKY